MQLKINSKNEIEAIAEIGEFDDGVEFNGSLPDEFESDFKPGYYLLQDDEIIVNPNYQEPTISIPTPEPSGPSPEMLAINALGIQLAKHLAGGN